MRSLAIIPAHAACEVAGTHVTRRLAFHMLLDAGMKALGNDVIKAAKGRP